MMSSSDEEEEEVPSKVCIYWIPSLLGGDTPQCRLPTYLVLGIVDTYSINDYNHKPIDFKYTIHENINDSTVVGSLKFIQCSGRCFIDWIEM